MINKLLVKHNVVLFYLICIGFAILSVFVLIRFKTMAANILPVALVLVLLALFRLNILYYITVLLVPLSVQLNMVIPTDAIDFYIPTELFLFGMLLVIFFKALLTKFIDKRITLHPITVVILIQLFWLLITSFTSTMPVVSFKFVLARLWFLASFYLLAIYIFRDIKNIYRFFWMYVIGLMVVIFYTINNHMSYGLFDSEAAHTVMNPFYRDHTSYGAVTAFYIPVLVGMLFDRFQTGFTRKAFIVFALSVVFTGFILSYARAAWVSILGAAFIWMLLALKFKFRGFVILVLIAILFGVFEGTGIYQDMERNNQDSDANIANHVQSVSNVSTDASNVERINRWMCAVRMFAEKPLLGWGPGTYMFQYGPFQVSGEKTIISTNQGDKGNAHSEYLGPLSESGAPGMLLMFVLIFVVYRTAFNLYHQLENKQLKRLVVIAITGLTTYYLHGFLNNFLDTDKISAPFWGFTAIIVAIDLYHKNAKNSHVQVE